MAHGEDDPTVGEGSGVSEGSSGGVGSGVNVGVGSSVGDAVGVGKAVGVGVKVGVGVSVGVGVRVGVPVGVGVPVAVGVNVGVAVGASTLTTTRASKAVPKRLKAMTRTVYTSEGRFRVSHTANRALRNSIPIGSVRGAQACGLLLTPYCTS